MSVGRRIPRPGLALATGSPAIPAATPAETAMTFKRLPMMLPPLAVVAGLFCAVAAGSAEAATYRRLVNVAPGHVAWMHRSPDRASPRVGYIKAGALRVHTLACRKLAKGGWCHVERRGTRGWVKDRFLASGAIMRG